METQHPPLEITPVSFADSRVQRLVDEVQAHYVVIYGGPDESEVDPHEFDPPSGLFLLGTVHAEPVAMGGWRRRPDLEPLLGPDVAEVKRMFVSANARRRGYAAAVLEGLERTARAAGVRSLVLETGLMQPEAITLYESRGYSPTVRYGHYADSELSRYYGKALAGP